MKGALFLIDGQAVGGGFPGFGIAAFYFDHYKELDCAFAI